jgi:putative MFS transporter
MGRSKRPENKRAEEALSVVSATSRSEASGVISSSPAFDTEQASANLIARMEQVPTSRWFVVARIVMGSATFFDAFNALSIAFVLPILVPLWHITPPEIGILIGASYVGQIIGALAFSWGAERYGRIPCAAAATAIYAVMSLACAAAWSFNILLALRFIKALASAAKCRLPRPISASFPGLAAAAGFSCSMR